MPTRFAHVLCILLFLSPTTRAEDPRLTLRVDTSSPGKPISADLWGIFFEDINYAVDGGLYAELIQNRSFEYKPIEQPNWGPLTAWELRQTEGARGKVVIDAGRPVHPNNPHYAVVDVSEVGEGVGLVNAGFDGLPVTQGATYEFSVFARQLYVDRRWGGPPIGPNDAFTLFVKLEKPDGSVLAETTLVNHGRDWTHLKGELIPTETVTDARLVVLTKEQGGVALDMISLFPRDTFRERPNGLRRDLAEAIEALRPRFVRFPGGCLVHGNGLGNMYRWKDTIGPVHERRAQHNIWGYHQTLGLGYFEYFQFCEDIGAKPVPIVPAAVCCQNSGLTAGAGQDGLPMSQMDEYIQEVLDLVEWANGPADSEWGALRAAAGHPAPFGLEYLGVGNEEKITSVFEKRFRMIAEALKDRHPEIKLIGTAGPFPEGEDYERGWAIARDMDLEIVDEHYYRSPQWFFENTRRYDTYDRSESQVYVGEYAAHDNGRRSTWRSALAEAAYMTHLERNGDVVAMASYAPLLGKLGRLQWRPDLIYFTNTEVRPTINYHVQRLFAEHAGERLLASTLTGQGSESLEHTCIESSETGLRFYKLVNPTDNVYHVLIDADINEGEPLQSITFAGGLDTTEMDAMELLEKTVTTKPVEPPTVKLPAHSIVIVTAP